MHENFTPEALISDLGLIMIAAAIAIVTFKIIKQPLVLGYIVAGFIVGPHFLYVPSVVNEQNIEFWAQIGIVVLLFSLGLEFSFKKLLSVGGSAIMTAAIIVGGMLTAGYFAGRYFFHFDFVNSVFLGGMLSMSSTTIIIKALTDLKREKRQFAPKVLAVLVVEDLFAVVMLVVLSSIAQSGSVSAGDMINSILKLVFYLILWFLLGIYCLPWLLKKTSRYLNDEMLLVLSMGLCFGMAFTAVEAGFSLALGAFVMGSILAGTSQAEHIEHIIKPVKDFFGAVFFISVGMMVNPDIIVSEWFYILVMSIIVIVGMIFFGTLGMLLTGQSLRIAVESGFCLVQIGEFAFIIATLGTNLGVLQPTLYPIIVAVSVVTTFVTPYFIKWSDPFYEWLVKHLPQGFVEKTERYSKQASIDNAKSNTNALAAVWRSTLLRLLLYSVVLITIFTCEYFVLKNELITKFGEFGDLIVVIAAVLVSSPFIFAIGCPSKTEISIIRNLRKNLKNVPMVMLTFFNCVYAFILLEIIVSIPYYHNHKYLEYAQLIGFALSIIMLVFGRKYLAKRIDRIEKEFADNLNERENRKSGKANSLEVNDLHVAYLTVGYQCPFVGERLINTNLGRDYKVNVVSIQRGSNTIPVPDKDTRLFPGDTIGIIGNDEQIAKVIPIIEKGIGAIGGNDMVRIEKGCVEVTKGSALVGNSSHDIDLRGKYSCLLLAIERDEEYITPDGKTTFAEGDKLWVVGDINKIKILDSI